MASGVSPKEPIKRNKLHHCGLLLSVRNARNSPVHRAFFFCLKFCVTFRAWAGSALAVLVLDFAALFAVAVRAYLPFVKIEGFAAMFAIIALALAV